MGWVWQQGGERQDGLFSVRQVVTKRGVTRYIDVVGFDFHGYGEFEPSGDVAIIDLLGWVLFLNLGVHVSDFAIVVMGSIRLGLKAEVGPTDKQLQYQYIIEVVAGCHYSSIQSECDTKSQPL